VTNITICNPIL